MTLIADKSGERVDQFLARSIEDVSRSSAQKLLESGCVLREGRPLRKQDKLSEGDEIDITIPEPEPLDAQPENIPLDIRYEDDDVVVINKPVGMVVHPAAGHSTGTLVNALLYHAQGSLSGIGGALRPGIVHRIDKDTSGLLIVAKNDKAHMALAAQLQDHSLYREYDAVVVGNLREEDGVIDLPIARHTKDRKKMAVNRETGKRAVTHWRVLARYPGYTHVQCKLETGRTHQIRVHFAAIGHPVLGDMVYGAKKPVAGLVGQCLHARRLSFVHPSTGAQIEVEAPLAEYFCKIVKKIDR